MNFDISRVDYTCILSVGKSCTHAVVLAQLVINNNNHGMHPFMVQLRSLDDHTPMPGE